jgi:hypothetical protein
MQVDGQTSLQSLSNKFECDALLLVALYQIAQRNRLQSDRTTPISRHKTVGLSILFIIR